MTPHNSAKPGEFAKTVLMPGDPLRSKYIAETFLTDPVLVNNVRGVQGYTGKWKDARVSVMASGMGMPSIGIYSWELYESYGVENIIRVGSAGAVQDRVNVMDIVIGQAASTNTNYLAQFNFPGVFAPIGDPTMIQYAVSAAMERGVNWHVGNLYSSWVSWPWRWRPPPSTETPPILAREPFASAQFPTTCSRSRSSLRRNARPASMR